MIKTDAIEVIDSAFRGIIADDKYKLVKANLNKGRYVEATYKYKNKYIDREIELNFLIPRFYIGDNDPIADIGTLSSVCRGLKLHDNYYMDNLRISKEKIDVEFYNKLDFTRISVRTLRDSLLEV
ncbi:hypothetical protein [Romboutsia sp. 1001713B170207_170306_H8]|uniref:hypothetical protein n=1 Tax=Romboutsia sp. 1001713B170207_170306_H8 TaxID=2787112 RepID=UPI001898E302|nr:hypothetical protein [Romboutsia sp. 1001713B170207_170306_H8]